MLHEAAVNFLGRTTALTPVQHELCPHRVGECHINTRLGQDIQGVLTGFPVLTEGRWCADFEGVLLGLTMSPLGERILSELGLGLSVGVGNEAVPDLFNKRLGHAVVKSEQVNKCAIGHPRRDAAVAGSGGMTANVISTHR